MMYGEAVAEWGKTGGRPVVIKRDTEQWGAWELYFHQFNVEWALGLISGKASWTVPSEYPQQFDARFDPSIGLRNRAAKQNRPGLPVDHRKAFVAKVRGFEHDQ